jgi:phage gpG-like protein
MLATAVVLLVIARAAIGYWGARAVRPKRTRLPARYIRPTRPQEL